MYKAIIVSLRNVRSHPNADKVKLATCLGNQVVIGLDNQEGDLGIYFPSDGQLSDEVCRRNNLYRVNTKNINPEAKPGMFDDNRRVRAQKFRGEISDGFWLPIELFINSGFKINPIEGYEFDEIDGVSICNKYVNLNTLNTAKQNTAKKTKTAKTSIMFKEHIDTAHFGKSVHVINDNDLVILTEKFHGCVHKDTIVNTFEHGDVTIGWIVDNKVNCNIKSMDTITGEIVYVPIDAFYHVPNDGEWYEIELEDGTKLIITGNNPVWLPDLGIYRRVDSLDGNEFLLVD